jgi:hypothetical protein
MDLLEKAASYEGAQDIVNDRAFNEQFAQSIIGAGDGDLTKQAGAGELYIKRRIRDRSVIRRVLDFKAPAAGELAPIPGEEMPVIWGTLAPESHGAVSLSMKDTSDQETFWREDFIVRFFVISTPEYYKNEFELRGHPQDTVKQLTEDMLLDLEDREDVHTWNGIDNVVGAPDSVSTETGLTQHFFAGEFSRDTYTDVKYLLDDRKLPRGLHVVNERFMANFEKLDRNDIGGDLSQEFWKKGGDALKDGIVGNTRHLFTNKNELVPNQTLYMFTAQDHLGIAREDTPPTMFMEKKKRTIFFSLEEIIAIGLINMAGVIKVQFRNKP